jgi:hypothetical protein
VERRPRRDGHLQEQRLRSIGQSRQNLTDQARVVVDSFRRTAESLLRLSTTPRCSSSCSVCPSLAHVRRAQRSSRLRHGTTVGGRRQLPSAASSEKEHQEIPLPVPNTCSQSSKLLVGGRRLLRHRARNATPARQSRDTPWRFGAVSSGGRGGLDARLSLARSRIVGGDSGCQRRGRDSNPRGT